MTLWNKTVVTKKEKEKTSDRKEETWGFFGLSFQL